jgi:hypothetical protein
LNKKLLDSGIADKSFNLAKNFGINSNGEIILIDIGELLSGEGLNNKIKLRPWSEKYVVSCIPEDIRDYFLNEMDKNFL